MSLKGEKLSCKWYHEDKPVEINVPSAALEFAGLWKRAKANIWNQKSIEMFSPSAPLPCVFRWLWGTSCLDLPSVVASYFLYRYEIGINPSWLLAESMHTFPIIKPFFLLFVLLGMKSKADFFFFLSVICYWFRRHLQTSRKTYFLFLLFQHFSFRI